MVTIWFADGTVSAMQYADVVIRDSGLTVGNVFYPWHAVLQIEKHPDLRWSSLIR